MTFLYILLIAVMLLAAVAVAYTVGRVNGFNECHKLHLEYYSHRAAHNREGAQ